MVLLAPPPGAAPVVPPALAAVHAPEAPVQYVPYACDYRGFLVQRRYRGTGTPQERRDPAVVGRVSRIWEVHDWFVPWHRPVLNPAAVAAAGFPLATVMAWAQVYGDAIFDHPTLAAYCLRWGPNPHGYAVEAVDGDAPVGPAEPVAFTARTDGTAEAAYYHLQTPLPKGHALLQELRATAGLRLGRDPDWPTRWATPSYDQAHRIVRARGFAWVWQQRHSVYDVTVAFPGTARPLIGGRFATAEEARQWYEALPLDLNPEENGPLATLRQSELLDGEVVATHITAQKALPTPWHTAALPRPAVPADEMVHRTDLTAWDLPPDEMVTTVAGLLDAQGLGLGALAQQLGMYHPTMYRRAHNPQEWTVENLLAVAKLTQRPLSELVALLVREMRPTP